MLAEPPDDRTQRRDPVDPAQNSDPGTVSSQIFDFVVFLLTTLVFGTLNRLGIKHSISEERMTKVTFGVIMALIVIGVAAGVYYD
jgi:hypothetical protein